MGFFVRSDADNDWRHSICGIRMLLKRLAQRLQEPGVIPRHFLYWRRFSWEESVDLSVFCDESGQQDMSAGYYLITLVMHNQDEQLAPALAGYELVLRSSSLPDVPFHMVDLLQGHGGYEGMTLSERKALLVRFGIFLQKAPIRYKTFLYNKFDVRDEVALTARMRRDIVDFIYSELSWFQSFDRIPVYYDEGQQAVTRALHRAFDFMLGDNVVEYKGLRYQDRRLAQAADYFCSIELALLRYAQGIESQTYLKFFGPRGRFKKNWLKQARRKSM